MALLPIVPNYKLMFKYDIQQELYEPYYRYIMGEFMPGLQSMKLYPFMVWHIAYGEYPLRQIEFVCESLEVLHTAFESELWNKLEARLKTYTFNYERKVVRFEDRFQF